MFTRQVILSLRHNTKLLVHVCVSDLLPRVYVVMISVPCRTVNHTSDGSYRRSSDKPQNGGREVKDSEYKETSQRLDARTVVALDQGVTKVRNFSW